MLNPQLQHNPAQGKVIHILSQYARGNLGPTTEKTIENAKRLLNNLLTKQK